ncbi:hypothetical protein NYS75_08960, partial [Staphylococcus aureus]|nr:hypothetical protein [Staphylococcus aureus]
MRSSPNTKQAKQNKCIQR